ncbi:hypothetical protein W97_08496 [Coniosporium apollinis CBS 100218]|uniref:C3H1-type domain-containing protein n=1 Tax=Coniosporium apollinis (strain CBS 100218) TaxID=1168221 RepID=R7Z5P3_CONA1|nr:uncharacterized protein W97_08496 [Coniosporium apollinis CBS 100218]EON69236.1 hypothetical protein W97_08496 [Coniosporium apollinis CBS 100218]
MFVDEADAAELKSWVVKRLEDISDADSDVLADYVLALVRSDDPDDQVKSNCLENLEDFLKEHTATFVDDVFQAIRTRAYLPGYTAPQPARPTGPSFNPPAGPAAATNRRQGPQTFQNGTFAQAGDQSRKRSFNDREGSEPRDGRDSHYGRGGERSVQKMRRGNNRGIVPETPRGPRATQPQGQVGGLLGLPGLGGPAMQRAPAMPQMPTPPPGFPPLDPNNPLAAILAMQALGFPSIPGFPPLPTAGSPTNTFSQPGSQAPPARDAAPMRQPGRRCQDYDTKGFCALGGSCPYEHGTNHIVVSSQSDEYDPTKSARIMDDVQKPTNGYAESNRGGSDRGRGQRGRGQRGDRAGFQGRGGRAAFSQAGPNNDRSNTSIVVEQIPEDKFDEQAVRDYFSEFGNIVDVNMQAYKRLAVVKYDDYWAARHAYESPKVIFDNRFVKVYWYKPDAVPKPPENGTSAGHEGNVATNQAEKQDEEMIDPAEFERKQAEAQKAHEEKMKKLAEAESQREELERKLKKQAEERKKLLEQLAAKQGARATAASASPAVAAASPVSAKLEPPTNGTAEPAPKPSQTEALKAKLAELEAEAQAMGIDPEEPYAGYPGRGRGRGGYRGRAGFVPRGRGFDPYRGSYRGRGSYAGGPRGGAVKRLDNRPKRVAVADVEVGSERDEALRQYLFNHYDVDSITPHPDHPATLVVAFKERYLAEDFVTNTTSIPKIGKPDLSWVPNPPLPPVSSSTLNAAAAAFTPQSNDQDVAMGEGANGNQGGGGDVDYDVADDEDRWMAVG